MNLKKSSPGEHRNEVPFLFNAHLDCGPVALAMACAYFGLQIPLPQIQGLVVAETSGATWTLGLAAAAAELGLALRMYSLSLGVNQANFGLDYYRDHAASLSEAQQKLATLGQRCAQYGGVLEERSVTCEELCDAVRGGAVPIVLLDWAKIINKPNYIGHFVPIVGFDASHIVIHNPGPLEAAPFMRLEREAFDFARKAPGTDEDVLILEGLKKASCYSS